MSGAAGLTNCHATVFNAVTALIMVKVIGLAIGDNQQQPPFARLTGQLLGHMADRRPKAGVMPRRQ
jgi:hypothetical protein